MSSTRAPTSPAYRLPGFTTTQTVLIRDSRHTNRTADPDVNLSFQVKPKKLVPTAVDNGCTAPLLTLPAPSSCIALTSDHISATELPKLSFVRQTVMPFATEFDDTFHIAHKLKIPYRSLVNKLTPSIIATGSYYQSVLVQSHCRTKIIPCRQCRHVDRTYTRCNDRPIANLKNLNRRLKTGSCTMFRLPVLSSSAPTATRPASGAGRCAKYPAATRVHQLSAAPCPTPAYWPASTQNLLRPTSEQIHCAVFISTPSHHAALPPPANHLFHCNRCTKLVLIVGEIQTTVTSFTSSPEFSLSLIAKTEKSVLYGKQINRSPIRLSANCTIHIASTDGDLPLIQRYRRTKMISINQCGMPTAP